MSQSRKLNRKIFYYLSVIGMVNVLAISILDKEFVAPNLLPYYLIVNAVLLGVFTSLLLLSHFKGFKTVYLKTFILLTLCHSCILQFFVPSSYLTLIICLFAYAMFTDLSKRFFLIISSFFSVAVIVCIWASPVSYSSELAQTEKFKTDASQTIVFLCSFIVFAHYLRMKDKEKYLKIEQKAYDLGNQNLSLIHDLKGQLTEPLNHVNFLMKHKKYDEEVVAELNESLQSFKEHILKVNQSFSFKEESQLMKIDLASLVDEVSFLYKNKLRDVQFKIIQTEEFVFDKDVIKSILLNLIVNSLDAFESTGKPQKDIVISYQDKKMTYTDNAGGFSNAALKKIKNREYFSDKVKGSGVGLFSVISRLEECQCSVDFTNADGGAKIVIKFK